jgi:hypothetical protein
MRASEPKVLGRVLGWEPRPHPHPQAGAARPHRTRSNPHRTVTQPRHAACSEPAHAPHLPRRLQAPTLETGSALADEAAVEVRGVSLCMDNRGPSAYLRSMPDVEESYRLFQPVAERIAGAPEWAGREVSKRYDSDAAASVEVWPVEDVRLQVGWTGAGASLDLWANAGSSAVTMTAAEARKVARALLAAADAIDAGATPP